MYLLDTNVCIALINGRKPSIRARLQKVLSTGAEVRVSAVVAFELWYGVAKSSRVDENTRLLETFLAGPLSLLAFEEKDAQVAGKVRASLESAGRPIGAYHVLIAGQALRNNLTLVTANVREFERIRELNWVDWGNSS